MARLRMTWPERKRRDDGPADLGQVEQSDVQRL